jgi:serine protease
VTSLDERLRQIGAGALEPLLAEVAESTGDRIERLSAQAQDLGQLYSVSFDPNRSVEEVTTLLEQDPAVEYAEPNYIAGIAGSPVKLPRQFVPNDQYYAYQWNMPLIQMPTAWDTANGAGVTVAIIDTGIAFNASDLAQTERLPGYDFVNNDTDPTDDQSHGTHVAGTVAQSTDNNIGVAGIAYRARLLPVKVLGADGNGTYENIIKGIVYATDQGAAVINMSLAGSQGTQALRDAVKYAHDRGVVVVAAAGNDGSVVAYPAAYDDFVIAVGAVGFNQTLTAYSNFGPQIDLVAPGGDVGQDLNNDGFGDGILQQTLASSGSGFSYRFFEGTSMASPHVAGLAALLRSVDQSLSPQQVEEIMVQSARNLGAFDQYGAGLIQAADALARIIALATPTPTAAPPITDTVTPTPPAPVTATLTPLPPIISTPTPAPPVTATPTPLPPITSTPTPAPPVTVTPTLTPVPPVVTSTGTPTPALGGLSPTNLIVNGGFETDEGWIFGDTPVRANFSSDRVQSGRRALKLGIEGGPDRYSYTSAWQKVAIPADADQVTLTVNVWPVSQDRPGSDIQNILILDEYRRVIKVLAHELRNSQNWETRTYDLSHLRGRTILVYFNVFNRGGTGKPTALYVDEVQLTWVRGNG